MLAFILLCSICTGPVPVLQSPAADRAARFEREDRQYIRGELREVQLHVLWKKQFGEGWADVRRHDTEIEQRFGSELAKRSMGFSQAAAVLPARTRRDGTRMPPTCVFGLPDDGNGSIWFLSPDGLDPECFTLAHGEKARRRFGFAIDVGPDLDGDGIDELIIAAPGDKGEKGAVYLFSVAERSVLLEVHAPTAESPFGMASCAVPDLDGDGLDEIAILSGTPEPRVHVISTNDCALLRVIELSARRVKQWWRPHHRLRVIPRDDGKPSQLLFVSMPDTLVDELAVIDIETGRPVWSVACPNADEDDGHWCSYSSVTPTEDLDGDGVHELLVAGSRRIVGSGRYCARYAILSGSTGVELRDVGGIPIHTGGDGEAFVADYPDIDCDGFREHIVSSTTVFGTDLFAFSGRTGETLYGIQLGELPTEYSTDILSSVDWNGDGTLDLELHDTDVWNWGDEQQLIVLSMADHEALHYIRPGDVERLILAREGWLDDPERKKPKAKLESTCFDFAKVPAFSAEDPCREEPRAERHEVDSERAPTSTARDLGSVMAVVPGFQTADDVEHAPLVAFGLEHDERGSLWFLAPGEQDPQRIEAPDLPEAVERFGKTLVLVDDVDGDGARDLVVGAESGGEDNTRFLLYSSAKRELIRELDARSSFHRAPLQSVPDQDGDGVEDLAFLAERPRLVGQAGRCSVKVQLVSGTSGESLRSFEVSRSASWTSDVRLVAIPGDAATPSLLVMGGNDLIALDLATGETVWSFGSEQRSSNFDTPDLCTTQDLNGDNHPDLLVGLARGRRGPALAWHCGRTGKRLRLSAPLEADEVKYGLALCDYVDTNEDGFRELLATRLEVFGSSVVLYDGRTGAPALRIHDPFTWGNGSFLDASVDWDGKGLPDLVLGSNIPTTATAQFCIISMEDHCVLRQLGTRELNAILALEAAAEDK